MKSGSMVLLVLSLAAAHQYIGIPQSDKAIQKPVGQKKPPGREARDASWLNLILFFLFFEVQSELKVVELFLFYGARAVVHRD
jgi:hypothetical protein